MPGGGLGRVAGFSVWAGWYVAITIVMLYVANTARELPTQRIVRLLAWMFVVTAGFGVLAMLVPDAGVQSPMELVLPHSLASTNFVRTLVHPSLSSSSDFLGYVQPRPTAPFPYSNAWGNNIALYLPFFMLACFGRDAGLAPEVGPLVLVGRDLPDHLLAEPRPVDLARRSPPSTPPVRLAVNGRTRALQALVAALLVGRHRLRLLAALRHRSCSASRPRTATTAGPARPRRWSR